jgi:hypothetical protein
LGLGAKTEGLTSKTEGLVLQTMGLDKNGKWGLDKLFWRLYLWFVKIKLLLNLLNL